MQKVETRMAKKQDLDQQYLTKPLAKKKKKKKVKRKRKENPFACKETRSNGK